MNKEIASLAISLSWLMLGGVPSVALPPPEDVPEEVLRTNIVTDGRSPIDGEILSPSEYAELMAAIKENRFPVELNSQIQSLVFQLRLLRLFKVFIPIG